MPVHYLEPAGKSRSGWRTAQIPGYECSGSRHRAAHAWPRRDGAQPCPPVLRRSAQIPAQPYAGTGVQRGAKPSAHQRPQSALTGRGPRLHEYARPGDPASKVGVLQRTSLHTPALLYQPVSSNGGANLAPIRRIAAEMTRKMSVAPRPTRKLFVRSEIA